MILNKKYKENKQFTVRHILAKHRLSGMLVHMYKSITTKFLMDEFHAVSNHFFLRFRN